MTTQSTPGKPTDSSEKKVLLPGYVLRQADGVFVNLPTFPVGGGFEKFIDRLFGDGFRFVHLDYQLLMNLLYDYDKILDTYGTNLKVRLADDIISFPASRKALYRGVKIDAGFEQAEYIFEPVEIEEQTLVGSELKSEFKPTTLDVDEFVAEMWLKRVRFGIDVNKVAGVISLRQMVRVTIASKMEAVAGSDAEIIEASEALRRDNSPKILPNGKADLRKFQNRFPQIVQGARLLKKKLRVPGKPGCKVNGERIEPEAVKDVDLMALAGVGTCLETHDGVEYIVAAKNGFLALDVKTNLLEVTENMENKAGISAKTTGDLSLAGKDFIEHGEVQEGRTVEGMNMTFLSDVFGTVISKGGAILLEKNLSNGCAKSFGGEITLNGRALNSIIEVHDRRELKTAGSISLNYAEGCLILGQSVVIKHAVNCEIIAENIEIEISEGCGIAGKSVKIDSSNACRRREGNIAMVLPDVSGFETKINQLNKAIESCQQIVKTKEQESAQISSNPEVAKYLALASNIKQSIVKLTEANQDNWKKMMLKFAKIDSALARLNTEKLDQLKRVQVIQQEMANLLEGRKKTGGGISCKIAQVVGDTLVRSMTGSHGIAELQKLKANDIKLKLRENGSAQERIFLNDTGCVDWEYNLPEIQPESPS